MKQTGGGYLDIVLHDRPVRARPEYPMTWFNSDAASVVNVSGSSAHNILHISPGAQILVYRDTAPQPHTIAATRAHRPSVAPMLETADIASRFNIWTESQLRDMHLAVGGMHTPRFIKGRDYSNGIYERAQGRKAKAHSALNQLSMSVRERLMPGQQWWADIGHVHTPDWNGDMYNRTFAEEKSSFVLPCFAKVKSTQALLLHLEYVTDWVPKHVPGARFTILRMDFGSEASRQGHGDDFIVQALKVWMTSHPYFRFVPIAPHANAYCKVENVIGQLVGHAAANAIRAHLGAAAWSLMERGAAYQHNCRPIWRPAGAIGPPISRREMLTGVRPDVSAMIGFVGQHGWAHNFAGRSNSYTDTASPIIYVCPSTECSAQIVFNIARATLDLVHSVTLSADADTTSLIVAQSELCKPRGIYGSPSTAEYEARIHSLLRPTSHHEYTMVAHDPMTGLPSHLYTLEPSISPEGDFLMLPATPPQPEQTPPHHFWTPTSTEHDVLLGPMRIEDVGPQETQADLPLASQLPDDARLDFRTNPKKPGSDSHRRYASYASAKTIEAYWSITTASGTTRAKALADLRYDILHHFVRVVLPATAQQMRITQIIADTEIDFFFAHSRREAPLPVSQATETAMSLIEKCTREATRLDNLEPKQRPGTEDSYNHGLLGDPRRYSQRYGNQAARAREGTLTDNSCTMEAQPDIPTFDTTFDIAPHTVMYNTSDIDMDIPRSVSDAMKRLDYDTPHGWKPAIIKEVNRVISFNAMHKASMQDYHDAVKRYGPHRVSGHCLQMQDRSQRRSPRRRRVPQIPHIRIGGRFS